MTRESAIRYHYCSLPKLVAIIRCKTMRLGNLFYMNDSMEVSWFFDLARRRIEQYLGGIKEDRLDNSEEDDKEGLVELLSLLEKRRFDHIYAACFSSEMDDLSQWRGYADDGRGVTLGIDLVQLTEFTKRTAPTLELMSVSYQEARQKEAVEELLEPMFATELSESSSSSSGSGATRAVRVFRRFAHFAPGFKNPAFSAERESRLVVRTRVPLDSDEPPDQWSPHWFEGFPSPIEFYEHNGRLVPFTKVNLPVEVIRSVGLGPRFGGYENEIALRLFLGKRLPSANVEVYRSQASYR